MSRPGPQPSPERVRELFNDAGDTLSWKAKQNNRVPAGKEVRTLTSDGYVVVRFDGRRHYAHRVLWILRHGPIPTGMEIDHRNSNRADNADSNHRLATTPANHWNQRRSVTNRSGVKGVSWSERRSRWEAKIIRHGRRYTTRCGALAEAEKFVRERRACLHGEFTNHG